MLSHKNYCILTKRNTDVDDDDAVQAAVAEWLRVIQVSNSDEQIILIVRVAICYK